MDSDRLVAVLPTNQMKVLKYFITNMTFLNDPGPECWNWNIDWEIGHMWNWNIQGELGQYCGCWCPGSSRRRAFSNSNIDYAL